MDRGSNPLKGPHPYKRDYDYGPDQPRKPEENKPDRKFYLLPIAGIVLVVIILVLGLAAFR